MVQNYYKQLILGIFLVCYGAFGYAQQAFFIPAGELTPSEKQFETLPYLTQQTVTKKEHKTRTYNDLKHYFKEHKWIAVMFDYDGYYSPAALIDFEAKNENSSKQYGDEILASLPADSYRNMVRLKSVPSMNLEITQEALELLYQNKKITTLFIDRETNSY